MSSGSGGTALATRFGVTKFNEADWNIDASWEVPTKDDGPFDRTMPGSPLQRTRNNVLSLTTTSVISMTTAAVERASADFAELTDHLLYVSKPAWIVSDHAQMIRMLREWTALRASDLAASLNVSRRSLYFWMGGGPISHENHERLSLLVEALRPLTQLRPERLRVWLTGGEIPPLDLLQSQQFESFRELAEEAISRNEIPILPARLINHDDSPGDMVVRPLSKLQAQSALMAFSRPRQAIETTPWSPPEISDSLEEDD